MVTSSSLSRGGTATGRFDPASPNCNLQVRARLGGLFDDFRTGTWAGLWSSPTPAAWSVADRALHHSGPAEDAITLNGSEGYSRYGCRVTVTPPPAPANPLGLRLGSVSVTWVPRLSGGQPGFQLYDAATGTVVREAASATPPRGDWLVLAVDRSVLFYLNGRRIFGDVLAAPVSGALSLLAADSVAFADVLVIQSPAVASLLNDGAGRTVQTQTLVDNQAIVFDSIYDALGRPQVTTRPAQVDPAGTPGLLAYFPGFAAMDWTTGQMTGYVATTAYPGDAGFPYSRQAYSGDPLARVVRIGAPGRPFAIDPSAEALHVVDRGYSANDGAYHLTPKAFYQRTLVDQDRVPSFMLEDQLGNVVLRGTATSTLGTQYLLQSYVYDDAGRAVVIRPPNYYEPPAGTTPDDWVSTVTYNFRGQVQTKRSPDAGESRYVFDPSGRLRFATSPQSAADGVVVYWKYDPMARVVEEGTITAAWDRGALQARADGDPSYPAAGPGTAWKKRYVYDGDGSQAFAIGMLWKTSVHNGGSDIVEERYEYGVAGRVVRTTLSVPAYDQKDHVVIYAYDTLGNPLQITYAATGEQPESLYRAYDDLGRLVGVGASPGGGASYVACTVTAENQVGTQRLGPAGQPLVDVAYDYMSPGWPQRVTATRRSDGRVVFAETLGYTAGGYDRAQPGYYNGSIAVAELQFDRPADSAYSINYAYDAAARLTTANDSRGAAFSYGVGVNASFDANSNTLGVQAGPTAETFVYQPGTNRLGQINDAGGKPVVGFGYDGNGNTSLLTRDEASLGLSYDASTQLTTSVTAPAGTTSFQYGGRNERVLKDSSPTSTVKLYVRGMSGMPLVERTRQGEDETAVRRYVYGPSGMAAYVDTDAVHLVIGDHLGSARVVLDGSAVVSSSYDYRPYGATTTYISSGSPDLAYLFGGHELDEEIQLYNLRARLYDPASGRYLSPDPEQQFFSPYLYVGNNPVVLFDPSGELGIFTAIIWVTSIVVTIVVAGATSAILGVRRGDTGAALAGDIFAGIGIALAAAITGAAAAALVGPVVGAAAGSIATGLSATAETAATVGSIAGGIAGGAAAGTAAGATSGLLGGAQMGLRGKELGDAVWQGALVGFVTGAVTGGFFKASELVSAKPSVTSVIVSVGLDVTGTAAGVFTGASVRAAITHQNFGEAMEEGAINALPALGGRFLSSSVKRSVGAVRTVVNEIIGTPKPPPATTFLARVQAAWPYKVVRGDDAARSVLLGATLNKALGATF
jgi:RHS repeat-associated protein